MSKPVILIVEDEWLLRYSAARMVEEAGFTVLEAANADEAIKMLEERSDIAVVFTDINMPGSMDGVKLARAIRDRWPPVRLILTSGQVRPVASDIPEGGRFLPKPYHKGQLVPLLEQMAA